MQDYFSRVYEIVAQIPEGKVMTYGQIAALLGNPRGARTVGWAMQSAPAYLDLPCHRVINKSGSMSPGYAFGGSENQRKMLEKEGVIFTLDGFVDLKKYLWQLDSTER